MDRRSRELSDRERNVLEQFRSNLGDLLTPDHIDAVLLKWLRADNFNLKKAEIHFREDRWGRMIYGIDTLIETYVLPEVFKYRGDTFLGFAKDGSPIRYFTARTDLWGLLQSLGDFDLILCFAHSGECDMRAIKEENTRTGRKNHEITYIFDLEGYSLLQFANKSVVETGTDFLRILQKHYPEIWGDIFFVNVPFIFDKLFSIFKPIMKDSLTRSMQVATKEHTGELLRQYIDDDVLPAFLGGTRVDSKGDIYCREFMNFGGKIPEKYYLRNCMHYINENDPGVKMVTVGPRSVFNVPLILREKGAIFRMVGRTENGSLYFCVLYREFGPDPENPDLPASDEYLDPHDENCNAILFGPKVRTHSHVAPADGRVIAIKPGIYILQFDNTDSWFTSRKLFYRVTLYPPDN